jgi:hypothetical protein
MKRTAIIIIATAIFVIAAASARADQTGAFRIGPVIEYTWWAPYFENYIRGQDQDFAGSALSTFSLRDSSLFFGPEAAYSFSERWSLTGRFLFAVQRGYRATGQYLWIAPGYGGYSNPHAQYVDRYDMDLVAGCALGNMVTIQFGADSSVYNYSGDVNMFVSSGGTVYPLRPSARMLSWSLGLSVGGVVKVPLAEGLSLDLSLRGLCLPGENRTNGFVKKKDPFVSYGGEGGLALSYFFKKINASITLGGKYQVLRYSLLPGADANEKNFGASHDQLYGVTASAIFVF